MHSFVKSWLAAASTSVLLLPMSCGSSNPRDAANSASSLSINSAQFFAAVPASSPTRLAAIGHLSMAAFVQSIRDSATDDAFTIDGHTFRGLRTRVQQQESFLNSLASSYATLGDFLAEAYGHSARIPLASAFRSDLPTIIKATGGSLGLTDTDFSQLDQYNWEPGLKPIPGCAPTPMPNTPTVTINGKGKPEQILLPFQTWVRCGPSVKPEVRPDSLLDFTERYNQMAAVNPVTDGATERANANLIAMWSTEGEYMVNGTTFDGSGVPVKGDGQPAPRL